MVTGPGEGLELLKQWRPKQDGSGFSSAEIIKTLDLNTPEGRYQAAFALLKELERKWGRAMTICKAAGYEPMDSRSIRSESLPGYFLFRMSGKHLEDEIKRVLRDVKRVGPTQDQKEVTPEQLEQFQKMMVAVDKHYQKLTNYAKENNFLSENKSDHPTPTEKTLPTEVTKIEASAKEEAKKTETERIDVATLKQKPKSFGNVNSVEDIARAAAYEAFDGEPSRSFEYPQNKDQIRDYLEREYSPEDWNMLRALYLDQDELALQDGSFRKPLTVIRREINGLLRQAGMGQAANQQFFQQEIEPITRQIIQTLRSSKADLKEAESEKLHRRLLVRVSDKLKELGQKPNMKTAETAGVSQPEEAYDTLTKIEYEESVRPVVLDLLIKRGYSQADAEGKITKSLDKINFTDPKKAAQDTYRILHNMERVFELREKQAESEEVKAAKGDFEKLKGDDEPFETVAEPPFVPKTPSTLQRNKSDRKQFEEWNNGYEEDLISKERVRARRKPGAEAGEKKKERRSPRKLIEIISELEIRAQTIGFDTSDPEFQSLLQLKNEVENIQNRLRNLEQWESDPNILEMQRQQLRARRKEKLEQAEQLLEKVSAKLDQNESDFRSNFGGLADVRYGIDDSELKPAKEKKIGWWDPSYRPIKKTPIESEEEKIESERGTDKPASTEEIVSTILEEGQNALDAINSKLAYVPENRRDSEAYKKLEQLAGERILELLGSLEKESTDRESVLQGIKSAFDEAQIYLRTLGLAEGQKRWEKREGLRTEWREKKAAFEQGLTTYHQRLREEYDQKSRFNRLLAKFKKEEWPDELKNLENSYKTARYEYAAVLETAMNHRAARRHSGEEIKTRFRAALANRYIVESARSRLNIEKEYALPEEKSALLENIKAKLRENRKLIKAAGYATATGIGFVTGGVAGAILLLALKPAKAAVTTLAAIGGAHVGKIVHDGMLELSGKRLENAFAGAQSGYRTVDIDKLEGDILKASDNYERKKRAGKYVMGGSAAAAALAALYATGELMSDLPDVATESDGSGTLSGGSGADAGIETPVADQEVTHGSAPAPLAAPEGQATSDGSGVELKPEAAPDTAPSRPEVASERIYHVHKGDSLWKILEGRGSGGRPMSGVLQAIAPEHRDAALVELFKQVDADPALRDAIGMRSEDADLIFAGEDLEHLNVLDQKLQEIALEKHYIHHPVLGESWAGIRVPAEAPAAMADPAFQQTIDVYAQWARNAGLKLGEGDLQAFSKEILDRHLSPTDLEWVLGREQTYQILDVSHTETLYDTTLPKLLQEHHVGDFLADSPTMIEHNIRESLSVRDSFSDQSIQNVSKFIMALQQHHLLPDQTESFQHVVERLYADEKLRIVPETGGPQLQVWSGVRWETLTLNKPIV